MSRSLLPLLRLLALAVGFVIITTFTPATPQASAATGCSQGNGYRNCRKEAGSAWVSVTTYPGVVKAAAYDNRNVWIDSDGGNHWAHGNGFAQKNGAKGGKWRACTWFADQFNQQYVNCTAWAQGY